jgi:acetate kinase
MNVLAINSGSSNVKFGLYDVYADTDSTVTRVEEVFSETQSGTTPREVFARIGSHLANSRLALPAVIGHRIVHGGPALRQHCVIDDRVMHQLDDATAFAPLHMPNSLMLIREAQTHLPGVTQVACFDTTFHANLPDVARTLPIAHELQFEGIQRYGFHGLSCESIVHQLHESVPDKFPQRLIIAHLGNGVSVTAVKDGKSIDTSMGLTPSGGVIMGTRSGDLDPGVLLYLLRKKKLDLAVIEELINHQSGLLGISGLSSDMRRLHEAASSNTAASNATARLAIEMFCYALRKQIAAMIAVLEGVDMIVVTGGIGENDAHVRGTICDGLTWLGVSLDDVRNRSAMRTIHSSISRCEVLVLPSQEDEQIARLTFKLEHVQLNHSTATMLVN